MYVLYTLHADQQIMIYPLTGCFIECLGFFRHLSFFVDVVILDAFVRGDTKMPGDSTDD